MITGKMKIQSDGGFILSENAELDPGGDTYTSKTTEDGKTHQMYEGTQPAMITFDKPMDENVDVIEIGKWKDKTITFEADTGQIYLIKNAFTVGTVKLKKESTAVEMHGDPAEKV
jgi:hypothetical protein